MFHNRMGWDLFPYMHMIYAMVFFKIFIVKNIENNH